MNIPSIKIRAGLWLLLLTGLILAGCAPKQRAVDDSFAFGNDYENLTGPDRSTMTPEERFAYDYRSAAVARSYSAYSRKSAAWTSITISTATL